jgi:hypothetical protein
MNEFVAIQAPQDTQGFVALARTKQGRLFKKQILPMDGSFTHPANPDRSIHVDRKFAETLRQNFKAGLCDIVQVPIVNDTNAHVEDPTRNIGEVVDVTYDDHGVYAVIDARKHENDLGKTLLGASALMHMNYADTRTGQKKGPTLLHVAITNRPYITNLEDFEEIVAASAGGAADTSGAPPVVMIPATDTEEKMDLDQMLSVLRDEHGIDVKALQDKAEAGSAELITALSNVLSDATGKTPPPSEALSIKDVADAVIELAEERVALSSQVSDLVAANEELALKEATAEVESLIRAGRILPKQRDTMIALSRTDRETFDALLPEDAIVALSAEGVDTHDAPDMSKDMQANIARLAELANKNL